MEIKQIISEILKININEIKDLKRFDEGMSNYTYYFKVKDLEYVFRKPGLDANLFVDYNKEYLSLKALEKTNLSSDLVYYDVSSGYKISKYLKGNTYSFENDLYLNSLIKSLKELHSIKNSNLSDYDLINRLNKYESYLSSNDISNDYYQIKTFFIKIFNEYFINNKHVFCHNDLQAINIINSNGKIKFIDFEYAALNDIYYDFATFENNAFKVYEAYYNKEISKISQNKILFYQMYQSIQWYLVATYKELVGFSKLTNYDFAYLANYFISNAKKIYEQIKDGDFDATS